MNTKETIRPRARTAIAAAETSYDTPTVKENMSGWTRQDGLDAAVDTTSSRPPLRGRSRREPTSRPRWSPLPACDAGRNPPPRGFCDVPPLSKDG
jgi:hypothetical protein